MRLNRVKYPGHNLDILVSHFAQSNALVGAGILPSI